MTIPLNIYNLFLKFPRNTHSKIGLKKLTRNQPNGVNSGFAYLAIDFRHSMPLECQPPVKAAHHRLLSLHVELKCVPVNGVNNRTYDGGLILSNSDDRTDK